MENVFSHTAGAWARGVVLSHVLSFVCQCFFADENFRAPVPPNPSFELKTYTLFVRYSLLRLSA